MSRRYARSSAIRRYLTGCATCHRSVEPSPGAARRRSRPPDPRTTRHWRRAARVPPGSPAPGELPAGPRPGAAAGASPGCGPPRCRLPCSPRNRPASPPPKVAEHRGPAQRPGLDHPADAAPVSACPLADLDGSLQRTAPTTSAAAGGKAREALVTLSDRKLVATLATARGEDAAPGAGAHPQAEAMRLVTAAVVRLERALAHGRVSECVRWCEVS